MKLPLLLRAGVRDLSSTLRMIHIPAINVLFQWGVLEVSGWSGYAKNWIFLRNPTESISV